ncbi:MAG TPA: choice-of-anchor D domain-containing protein [Casimicrobiaceae bacterium]
MKTKASSVKRILACLCFSVPMLGLSPAYGDLDLTGTSPAAPGDPSPDAKFLERAQAVTNYNLAATLLSKNCHGDNDYGEAYHPKLFARFEYSVQHPGAANPGLAEAIDSLRNLNRSDQGAMGTDTSLDCDLKFGDELLGTLEGTFSDAIRKGDYDTLMSPLVTVLYRYGKRGTRYGGSNLLPADVYTHVLSLIDLSPGIGNVETLSFGGDPLTTCPLVCAATGNPFVCAGCVVAVEASRVSLPETENHINNIYVAQYLANQLWFDETGDPKYDNSRNGYRPALLNRLKAFVRNDFVEYNSHPYQDYTLTALLNLYSFADDAAVKSAAKMILDYVSAKVAVSSNDARRSTPFRRRNEDSHKCDELVLQNCHDPATAFYMMLAGNTDILENVPDILPSSHAPDDYALEFQWVSATNYRLDPLLLDLFVNRAHRNFYQFFHYSNTGTNDELYFGSPSYLLSAGGHPADYAYTADVPFPLSLITGEHPGKSSDLGIPVATTLMPTGELHSREQMIRFSEPNENMCVAPNFACGQNPVIGSGYPAGVQVVDGNWTFIDKGAAAGSYGYYVALYQQDGFGFLEVHDTYAAGNAALKFEDFQTQVKNNNAGRVYSASDVNTYRTIDGTVIQFKADARIVSVNGNPPYDPNRTNGTIIDSNGQGVLTITNPALGTSLTLDATAPAQHPQITVPGPLNFADTCVGSQSFATLDVCNSGNGSDDLSVYNITSMDTRFSVTEPSSGYPTTIGANFCFPFQAQFAPNVAGALSSKLKISNSDPNVPFLDVAVNGNGIVQAIATVMANAGNFGNVCLGSFVDLNLTINNTGGCTLVVSNIASSSPDFKLASTLSFPLAINAGGSLSIPIRFQPSQLGAASANITVTTNDPAAPNKVVTVSGMAPPGKIALSGSGSYGDVCGGSNAQQILTVANTGACNLNVTSVTLDNGSGGLCPDFAIRNNPFPNTLSHDSNLPVTTAFTPTSGGVKSCRLVIASDDPTAPVVTVPLTADTPPVNLAVPTAGYTFPATVVQNVGACSSQLPFPVSNNGICPVTINSVVVGGTNGGDYSLASLPSLATPLSPGHVLGEGNLGIVFKPTVIPLTRHEQGSVTVTYEDDPITHHRTSATQNVCGEDASTGVRLLVTSGGVPLATVDKIQLHRLTSNRLGISSDNVSNVKLQPSVQQAAPCASFQYHREWGGASNPVQLTAGDYQITVTATPPGSKRSTTKTVSFSLDTCSFNQNITVSVP